MEFTSEHKKEIERTQYFDYGVHKVLIVTFNHDTTDNGKEYVEVFFTSENGECEDSARVWFTTDKAANFSFNTLRGIYVHNAPEAKKDAARASFDKVANVEEMVDLLNKNLGGKEMWFTKYVDPTRTYIGTDGVERQSINKNIYAYEPKLREDLMPKKSEGITEADVAATFPGATPVKSVDDAMEDWGN